MAEPQKVVNNLTAMAPIKAGALDSLRKALAIVGAANPSPIEKVETVHFARWVIFDNGTRLLFAVDFDGPWDEYIDDFIDNAAQGLDLVFGHCDGYPAGGSKDRDAFKQYVRQHQAADADVLSYSAYPSSTVKDIRKGLRVRDTFEALLDLLQ